jgi:hypothetical protein
MNKTTLLLILAGLVGIVLFYVFVISDHQPANRAQSANAPIVEGADSVTTIPSNTNVYPANPPNPTDSFSQNPAETPATPNTTGTTQSNTSEIQSNPRKGDVTTQSSQVTSDCTDPGDSGHSLIQPSVDGGDTSKSYDMIKIPCKLEALARPMIQDSNRTASIMLSATATDSLKLYARPYVEFPNTAYTISLSDIANDRLIFGGIEARIIVDDANTTLSNELKRPVGLFGD